MSFGLEVYDGVGGTVFSVGLKYFVKIGEVIEPEYTVTESAGGGQQSVKTYTLNIPPNSGELFVYAGVDSRIYWIKTTGVNTVSVRRSFTPIATSPNVVRTTYHRFTFVYGVYR